MAWDTSKPAGTDAMKTSDEDIRDNWSAIETGLVPYDYIRLEAQGSAPTAVASHGLLYAYDVSSKAECHYIDEDSNTIQMTSGGKLGASTTDILANTVNFGNSDLDYYGESTFTPTIKGSSADPTVGYTTQTGLYTRVGNLCYFNITIDISSYSGGSGNFYITGLPFTSKNSTSLRQPVTVWLSGVNIDNSAVQVACYVDANTTNVRFQEIFDNAAVQHMSTGDFAAGDLINVSGVYMVN